MKANLIEHVRSVGARHSAAEDNLDLPATMETLVEEPEYHFLPIGLVMRGRGLTEAYYEHLFTTFMPMARGARLIGEWCNETSFAEEYVIEILVNGVQESHQTLGIMQVEGDLIKGERIWGSERLLRLMMGNAVFEQLEKM